LSSTAERHPAFAHHFESLENQKDSASFGMWVFIAQEVMFFGGLFLAYAVYRLLYPHAFAAGSHHLNVTMGAINTVVLICSSLTMAMAVHAAALGKRRQIVAYVVGTILLGTLFLGIKTVEYHEKFEARLVPGSSFSAAELHLEGAQARQVQIYYSLYFGMTGLHALHMVIGIPILAWIAVKANRGHFGPQYYTPVELTGLYWHFVDIIWIFLFPLLYLIPHH
jgi:cytochrome c oxidase subunit 3